VKVMNIREDDQVSAVALVVESDASTAAPVAGESLGGVASDDGLSGAEFDSGDNGLSASGDDGLSASGDDGLSASGDEDDLSPPETD
jgi:hypothetical protein